MLRIDVPARELYNEITEEFETVPATTLTLEHSLVSLSKWESKWCKPFLGKGEKTTEETLDYIRCMTLTQNVNPNVYRALSNSNIEKIRNYIDSPMTATTFREDPNAPKSHEIITSELIYYWMIALNIPVEFQKWHLNRLLTLIRVCNIKNRPPKKMSQRQIMANNTALNNARKRAMHTKG